MNPGDSPDDGQIGDVGIGFGGISAGLHNNWFDGNYDGGDFDAQLKVVGSNFGTFVPGDLSLFYKMYGSGNKVNGYEILADAKIGNARLGSDDGRLNGGGRIKIPDVGSIGYLLKNGISTVDARLSIERPGDTKGAGAGKPIEFSPKFLHGPGLIGAGADLRADPDPNSHKPGWNLGGEYLHREHGTEWSFGAGLIWDF